MNWIAILTAAVAVYGAGLSTYTLIRNLKEKQRQVNVNLSNGCLTFGPELSQAMIFIEASNPGNRTVILNTVGISLPDKRTLVFPNPESNVHFPHPLPEGTGCMVWTPLKELAQRLTQGGYSGRLKLVGYYRDQVGTLYTSNTFALDIDGWLE